MCVLLALSCARSPRVTPSPSFSSAILLEQNADETGNVSIGDLDRDGNLDILLVKGRHSPRVDRVLFGDGRGGFPRTRDVSAVADRSYSGSLVDVDRDGDLDIVMSNDAPDPKVVHLNDGAGNFTLGGTYGQPSWVTRNATVADMNGDGLPDIIVANRTGPGPGANYICLNQGGGRFDADCIVFSRESATTITAADVNRDGFMDLVVPHRDGGQSHVYVNDGKPGAPAFTRVAFGPARATIRVSDVGDFDADGRLDIVTADERRGVMIYFGQSGPTWSAPLLVSAPPPAAANPDDLPPGSPYALLVGDVNRDGRPDILVGKIEAPSAVLFNDGTGRRFTTVNLGDAQGTPYGFAIADVNKDGRVDIAVARSGAPNVLFFGK